MIIENTSGQDNPESGTVSADEGTPQKPAKKQKQVIIAIGASAGGLEALKELLGSLPPTIGDASIIVAQHVSPTHKSMLVQLLGRDITLKVVEAIDTSTIEMNTVYITPPDKQIIIDNGHIRLRRPDSSIGPKPSVDTLFYSLAEQSDYRVIGVILSGTGSDGASGIRALKQSGGYILVQDPTTAKYDGMPRSALQTGMYDATLSPDLMGARIMAYIQTSIMRTTQELETIKSDENLEEIFRLLGNRTGTNFQHYKRATIARRLTKRLEALQIETISGYLAYLQEHPGEIDEMFASILIGVTSFNRDQEAFEKLSELIGEMVTEKGGKEQIRVWVPGCSTGEEAYTIAILLYEHLGDLVGQQPVQIFATDIDEEAVRKARKGLYSIDALQKLPEEMISRYFQKKGDNQYELDKAIRSLVLFSKHDVTRNPPFLKLDLISCRNLLIYFDDILQKQVLPIFHYALNTEGILFLGKSESVGQYSDLFGTVDGKNKIFRRRIGRTSSPIRLNTFPNDRRSSRTDSHVSTKSVAPMSVSDMVKETLFNTYEHAYVVIDTEYNVVETSGDVRLFVSLPSGSMQLNLLRMMNAELQIEGRSVISKAIAKQQSVSSSIRKFLLYEKTYYVRITAKPLLFKQHTEALFVVIFERLDIEPFVKHGDAFNETELVNNRIQELEHELAITKEHLQTYIEEIETSNEELQSLNEELQSSNEELQSSNEELETTNEELQSTNEEIQIAYAELNLSKRDLEEKEREVSDKEQNQRALLGNTLQAFMLVDRDFRVIEFNRTALKMAMKLGANDLKKGDSILSIGSSGQSLLWIDPLKKALRGENTTGEVKETDTNGDDLWLSYHFTPILDRDGAVTAVTIGFIDITEKKHFSFKLNYTERLLHSIFDASSTGICITDENGLFMDMNSEYCRIYGYSREELIGQPFTMVVPDEFKGMLIKLHEDFISGKKELDAEWMVQRKDGRRIDIFASAKLLTYEDGSRFKVTTIHDITESKKYENMMVETQQTARIGGWELDAVTGILGWTEETYNIFRVPGSSAIKPEMMYRMFANEGSIAVERAINTALTEGTPFDMEVRLASKTENERWVRLTCKPIVVYNTTVKLFGTIQDVSERRLNEEMLHRTNRELLDYKQALDQASYVIIFDANGIIQMVNDMSCEISGFLRDELIGQNVRLLSKDCHDEAFYENIWSVILTGKVWRGNVRNRKKSGAIYWIDTTIVPFLDEEGNPYQFVSLRNDVTQQVDEAVRLSEMESQIRKSLKEKEILLAEIHHRVKNNLAVVSSMLQLQVMEESNIQVQKKLYDSIFRISAIAAIHEDLYKSQDFSEISFARVIERLVNSVSSLLQGDKSIEIEYDTNDFRLPMNQAIPSALILSEVITNIFKHAFPNSDSGKISVFAEQSEEGVRIRVRDNGVGLPANYDVAKADSLGMQLVRTLTDQLLGEYVYQSSTDGGTEFELKFRIE
jgi:two-component system, chemotaxis family, CheB/CheR fusion protein